MLKGLVSNLGSLLLALVLAFTIWVIATREEFPSGQFSEPIPVSRTGLTDNLSVFGETLSEVQVQIRAPKARWTNLHARDFTGWIDLAGLSAGEFDVRVQVLPPDPQVQVLAVDPPVIRVRLEEKKEKQVPVHVNILDAPAFGYNWQTPVISPTLVTVSGSAPLVDQVDSVGGDIYLRNARGPVERDVRVTARTANGETLGFVTIAPREVRVTVPIVQLPGYRELAVLVEPKGSPASGYTVSGVSAEPKLVTVQGDPAAISELSGYITVPVGIVGASANVVERVPLTLPENVSALGVQSVTAQVNIVPTIGVQTVRRKPVIQGLGPGLAYTMTLDSVSVFLSGPVPKLLALKPGDAPVILDVTGLGPGVHVIEPQVPAPGEITVEGLSPQTVEVTIGAVITPAPLTTPPQAGRPTARPGPTMTPTARP